MIYYYKNPDRIKSTMKDEDYQKIMVRQNLYFIITKIKRSTSV